MAHVPLLLLLALPGAPSATWAASSTGRSAGVRIAVAADFANVARHLAADFTARSGIRVTVTSGASGALTNQIRSSKKFDVFLSADTGFPQQLIREGLATSPKPVVYAFGTIGLFSRDGDLSTRGESLLTSKIFSKLAVADPAKAPYGRAAMQTLEGLGLSDRLKSTLVFSANVAKTLKLVETGNADAGFVAFPDLDPGQAARAWLVPSRMHKPIKQAAVLLTRARDSNSANRWMQYLLSDSARRMIRDAGYRLPPR
jgi:molybdate transport system substrate-binding protein